MVELLNSSKSVMIKAETKEEIILKSIEKLKLPDAEYKVLLDDKKTEVDDDVIEYASQITTLLKLVIVGEKDIEDNVAGSHNTTTNENISSAANKILTTKEIPSISSNPVKAINLQEEVWNKLPFTLLNCCKKGEKLSGSDRILLVKTVTDYMIYVLKDTSRGMAGKIASTICKNYPATFAEEVEGEIWGNGVATLRTSILNGISYKQNLAKAKGDTQKKRANPDTDEEEIAAEQREVDISRKQDEYGCVEYAPDLPLNETEESQEEKRLELVKLFQYLHHDSPDVLTLMQETYATQRKCLTDKSSDLSFIIIQWPFLTDVKCLLDHSSKLLGKNVVTTWMNSMNNKIKPIRKFLKMCKALKTKQELETYVEESKEAEAISKDNNPKILIVFPLLLLYFQENENLLYKIIDTDATDQEAMQAPDSNYPMLIIRGKSLYDATGTACVVFDRQSILFCNDSLEGILVMFLAYYVFGYAYKPGIQSTLEFIQRVFLQINPESGSKKLGSKHRKQTFNKAVFKLAKALSAFSDHFKID